MQFSLEPSALALLPLGTIKPSGWLLRQLQLQANGLTGHLDEFWPSVKDSRWIGGDCEGWERGPYWLDGLIPLAFLLDDVRLKAKARHWIDRILSDQHPDGWLGAKDDAHEGEGQATLDPWPLFVLFKAFLQWHEATQDERIVPALLRCAARVHSLLESEPLRSWAWLRWAEFVLSLHHLYDLSGQEWLLELAALCKRQGFDWNAHFADLPAKTKTRHDQLGEEVGLPLHGVNNAMGLKTGPVWWRQSRRADDFSAVGLALRELDRYHGAASGMFNADEHLAGLSPSQGFETCAVVEEMFSLEVAGAITGEAALFDRLEQIAFNALPASTTPDFWAHQYHQQTNQVLCSVAPRDWTDSGPRTNLFGQDVNFGCCQANVHQGWPKLTASLWMQHETGFCAVAFAPCELQTVWNGVAVVIKEETDYPFRPQVRFVVQTAQPVRFALRLRQPAWTDEVHITVNGEEWLGEQSATSTKGFLCLERDWCAGDEVVLHLPMPVRGEVRHNGALSLHRGPLLLAWPLEERQHEVSCPYTESEPLAREFELLPASPQAAWNYALAVTASEGATLEVQENGIGAMPFERTSAPLKVEVPARRLPAWTMHNNSAAPPPSGPVATSEPLEILEVVPYGSARLRIAEFPLCPVEDNPGL